MDTIDQHNGISVNLPDSLKLEKRAQSTPSGRRTTALPSGPIPVSDAKTIGDIEQTAILEVFAQQGLVVAKEFVAVPAPEAVSRLRSAPGPAQSEEIGIQVELSSGEEAVVLSERDGYYSWHFPEDKEILVGTSTRRGVAAGPVRRATFKIALHPLPVPADMRLQRGVIGDFLFERVKTYVLKFVAGAVLGNAMKYLERHVQKGLVVLKADPPEEWRRIETLHELSLPADRPGRILLFIHGTFSSTVGSYGALGLTPWGKAFLKSAQENYDILIGYDHSTLSEDPFENATDLLQRLSVNTASPIHIDAVCFSRGALVYRALTERALPGAGLNAQFGRVIFAASTNGGTKLAEPDNWHDLADLYTNLAVGTTRVLQMIAPAQPFAAVFGEIIKSLGALVKYMATAAVSERRVPGLAAMEPDGDFIRSINQTQPGQIEPAVADYYAIISNFKARLIGGGHEPKELPARLVLNLANKFADRLMGGSNDLVVNTDSMTAIDSMVGGFIKDVFDFGENSAVYHTNYFTRPETANALVRWLRLPQPAGAGRGARRVSPWGPARVAPGSFVTPDVPVAVDIDFSIVNANDRVEDVMATVRNESPSYVVINREYNSNILNYAFPAEELLDRSNDYALHDTIGSVLGLHESDAEPALSARQASVRPATAGRSRRVVLEAGYPIGVAPGSEDFPPSERLGELAERVVTPKTAKDSVLARRSMPNFTANAPPAKSEAKSKQAICHFHAEMEEEILFQRVSTVEVIVSREAIERALGPTAAQSPAGVAVNPERKITIQVIPRANCEIVGEDRVEVEMPAAGNPLHVYFDVRATHLGEGAVWVLARQGQVPLVTLALAPQIVQQHKGPMRRVSAEAATPEAAPLQHPLNELRIVEQLQGNQSVYDYEFTSPDLHLTGRFQSKPFQGQRAQYVDNIYREIEEHWWLQSERDKTDFQFDLRAFGADLFEELIPKELQRQLWQHRKEIRSIMVLSTEPFIPWELVHLKDPDASGMPDETLYLGQMGLVRWLFNTKYPPVRLQLDRVRYVIPDYPDQHYVLPETEDERKFLEQHFQATPIEPQPEAVRNLLSQPGSFDVLHFACHGAAEHGDIANARLMLQGRLETNNYVPAYLSVTTIGAFSKLEAPDGTRPMIVLNACQSGKAGYKLTGLGGFAQAFLKNGAGAFVGTLWSVGDFPARTFTEKFYCEMSDNHNTLAEAAISAREAAREAGDATWLAYAVYGHPHAVAVRK